MMRYCFLLMMSVAAMAADITIEKPYARATAPRAVMGAVYAEFVNDGAADQVIAVRSDACERVEIHTISADDQGVLRMQPIPTLDLAAHRRVSLKPGGQHLMLVGLKAGLVEGATVSVTVTFAHAAAVTVQVPVAEIDADRAPCCQPDHATDSVSPTGK